MPVTNNLKPVLDQPVWEWMQNMPVSANVADNGWTTSQSGKGRYIYYMRSSAFYRHDTYSNVWQTLLSPTYYNTTTVLAMHCQLTQGTRGRILEQLTATKFRLPYLAGGTALVNEEISITYGPGAQETRTITISEDPTIHDSGIITTTAAAAITDSNKKWKVNQWVGYTCRIISGTNQMEQRNILYNTETQLTFLDVTLQQYEPWDNQGFRSTPTASATYEIASQIVEIDTPFNVTPTANSRFMVKTGIIWLVSSLTAAPFFTFQMYDILTNTWYQKTMNQGLFTAAIGTEVQIESTSDIITPLVDSTVTAGAARSITDTALTLETDRYRNYNIRIVGGTGAGQNRRIIGNKLNYFEVDSRWTTIPNSTSEYEVYPDDNLVYFIGNANAATFAYHMEADMWITGPYFDYGVLGNSIVKKAGDIGYGITSAVRAVTGVTSISMTSGVAGSGYIVGDVLTIATGSATAQCYVTATNTAGGVTGVELRRCGTTYATGVLATTGGSGTGCQINVISVGIVGTITTTINNMLKTGDAITISGANDGAWNTGYAIKGVWGSTTFDVEITAAATLIPLSTTTTTLLVDANESWDVDEHKGKFILVMAGGNIQPLTQVRRIASNTANTITVPAVGAFTPTTGTTRYIILDPASYGRSTKFQAKDMYPFGYATSGTTTTIVDNTKNWIRGNWIGHVVRITAGTGLGAELIITANNATTLVFATAAFTPDTTTRYEIMDSYGTATSGSATTIMDTTKNWVPGQWIGKRLRFTGGVSQGVEVAITSNSANILTFTTIATQDTNSNYVIMDPPARGVGCGLLWTYANGNDNYLWASTGNATTLWQRLNINNQIYDFGFMITGFLADSLTTGTTYAYDGKDTIYIQNSNTGSLYQLNVKTRIADLGSKIPGAMSTAFIGNRMCIVTTPDNLSFLYIGQSNSITVWRTLLFW